MTRDDERVRLCRARAILEGDAFPEPSLADIARGIGLSESHFARRFKAWFGETPHQYRIRAKLQRARELLAIEGRSVTQACFDLGYTSLGSFSDSFRRRTGESPERFRRRLTPPTRAVADLQPGCLNLMPSGFGEAHSAPLATMLPTKEET